MVFSSAIFLFCFFPIVCIIYFCIPKIRAGNIFLIAASLIFYAFGEPVYIAIMLASIVVNYILGLLIAGYKKHKKIILIISVIGNIGILCLFKYTAFIIENVEHLFNFKIHSTQLPLPIGISFFTFQALSYVIDVYRQPDKVQKNLFNLMLYISFFPQLIAGPIIRYSEIEKQITSRKSTIDKTVCGIQKFIRGLAKKILIANVTGYIADSVFMLDINNYSFIVAWVGALSYTLQIYYDFSGYSDMAIGMAQIFGFEFRENFEHPYSACGIKDFWHRWHISLSLWFKEYVYIPLGGNRKGKLRTEINKLIVFTLTGIWHGANWTFMIWGFIHGMANVFEDTVGKVIQIRSRVVRNIATWIIVITAFVMFRADNVLYGFSMIKTMFSGFRIDIDSISYIAGLLSPYYIFILLIAVLFSYPIREKITHILGKKMKHSNVVVESIAYSLDIVLLLFCIMNLAASSYNPFIYFRF